MKKTGIKTFSQRAVEAALTIPEGRVTTYGRIAKASGGGAQASRSITAILAKAYKEDGVKIPFHRIVYSNGTVWVSEEYRKKRLALYKKEGIEIDKNNKIKNFKDILFELN